LARVPDKGRLGKCAIDMTRTVACMIARAGSVIWMTVLFLTDSVIETVAMA
jgi:hypothetical protein